MEQKPEPPSPAGFSGLPCTAGLKPILRKKRAFAWNERSLCIKPVLDTPCSSPYKGRKEASPGQARLAAGTAKMPEHLFFPKKENKTKQPLVQEGTASCKVTEKSTSVVICCSECERVWSRLGVPCKIRKKKIRLSPVPTAVRTAVQSPKCFRLSSLPLEPRPVKPSRCILGDGGFSGHGRFLVKVESHSEEAPPVARGTRGRRGAPRTCWSPARSRAELPG
ncbi:uncharacterized protein LOC114001884 [Pipra filicauda]|uniref:Uncharacterized protein LOC114001884 n=1 Tax=Pipra filicauda TaxID=649802 RepID=A0A7R5L223_9PASS|nr:uncharacterized protein LOC114001884 [Pipra filicauda]